MLDFHRIRIILCFVVLCCLPIDCKALFAQSRDSECKDDIRKAIVKITDDERNVGTGFVIAKKAAELFGHGKIYILTAYHVVQRHHIKRPRIEFTSCLRKYGGKVRWHIKDLDLAIIVLDGEFPPVQCLELDFETDIQMGQQVYTCGYKNGDTLCRSNSRVSMCLEENIILQEIDIDNGNSGGPLLCGSGRVIGVILQKPLDHRAPYYARRIDKLIDEIIGIAELKQLWEDESIGLNAVSVILTSSSSRFSEYGYHFLYQRNLGRFSLGIEFGSLMRSFSRDFETLPGLSKSVLDSTLADPYYGASFRYYLRSYHRRGTVPYLGLMLGPPYNYQFVLGLRRVWRSLSLGLECRFIGYRSRIFDVTFNNYGDAIINSSSEDIHRIAVGFCAGFNL